MKLEDMEIYNISMEIGDEIWFSVIEWENLAKYSIGQQIVRSADSIAANISEGYGRYHYLDKCKFYYNARGSLLESRHWFSVLFERTLIDEETFLQTKKLAEEIHVKVNALIQSQRANNNKQ